MSTLSLKNINKIYDNNVQAVFDFNLDIKDKEFIVFVGPSGCGKSTTLRMIAGLESISSGELYIDEKLVNDVLPRDRDVAMVFQNYALYPHMSVFKNMGFGLKMRKFPKEEINKRVMEAAEILELTPYLKRKPSALSGGQRQRVALGRAIVRDPKVFLMDEPLSNLDAKLRVTMRSEIKRIHEKVGATTIYVTHDQTEAMTMADRIVIMKDGYVQQIGTPNDVYNNPSNMFVAGFIGSPGMNFIEGTIEKGNFVIGSNTKLKLNKEQKEALKEYENKEVIMGIRPDDFEISNSAGYSFKIEVSELLGHNIILYGNIDGQKLVIMCDASLNLKKDDTVYFNFKESSMYFFDKETSNRIR